MTQVQIFESMMRQLNENIAKMSEIAKKIEKTQDKLERWAYQRDKQLMEQKNKDIKKAIQVYKKKHSIEIDDED